MNYLGIDCGMRKLHCVLLDENRQWLKHFIYTSKEKESLDASFLIAHNFQKDMEKLKTPMLALIETPIYLQNAHTSFGIAAVAFKAELVLQQLYVPILRVDNKRWKKWVVGKGNCTKLEIKEFVEKQWGENKETSIQDLCDAACLALYGIKLRGGQIKP